MSNQQYIRKILRIIGLTIITAFLSLPFFFSQAVGWILGAIASMINFYWLARNVQASLIDNENRSKLIALKGALFRYLFLISYSLLLLWLIKPDLIFFGLGILSTQIAIYLNEIVERIKGNQFFRG